VDLPGFFGECTMNRLARKTTQNKKAGANADLDAIHNIPTVRAQQVALPQRAVLIFSFRLSTPTAPITTCLPIT
jgi:hypothetical protein